MFCSAPFGFLGTPVVPSSAWAAAAVSAQTTGGPSTAAYTFNTDGTTTATISALDSGSSSGPPWEKWANPPTSGAGSAYWIKVTVTGAAVTGTTGTWLQLSSARTWTLTRSTTGTASSTLSVQISSDAAGATIVASGSIFLDATRL